MAAKPTRRPASVRPAPSKPTPMIPFPAVMSMDAARELAERMTRMADMHPDWHWAGLMGEGAKAIQFLLKQVKK